MGGFIVGCCLAVVIILIISLGKKFANKRKKNDNDAITIDNPSDNNKFEEKE